MKHDLALIAASLLADRVWALGARGYQSLGGTSLSPKWASGSVYGVGITWWTGLRTVGKSLPP